MIIIKWNNKFVIFVVKKFNNLVNHYNNFVIVMINSEIFIINNVFNKHKKMIVQIVDIR